MIGIYKIENKINGKVYIGQSVEIEKRLYAHKKFYHKDSYIDNEINKLGVENFSFTIVEECQKEELDTREQFYIQQYNSLFPSGYNLTVGGQTINGACTADSLSEDDIIFIRTCYKNRTYTTGAEIQRIFFPDIDRHIIAGIYNGTLRPEIMPEVYQEKYTYKGIYSYQSGERNKMAVSNDLDVLKMRIMYSIFKRQVIFDYFKDKYSERTITSIISGQNWKHLPIYKKRERRWLFPEQWTEKEIYEFTVFQQKVVEEFPLNDTNKNKIIIE